jgi:ABC-type multidrug transport system ATPase subunit
MGLLVGSSDPEELISLCDRIVAIRRGTIAAEWPAQKVSERQLLSAITGSDAPATKDFISAELAPSIQHTEQIEE